MAATFESQGLELKKKVENFREVSKTACAFANAFGGRITIGVASDGRVVGVPEHDLDSLQQRLEGAIQQVSPVPFHKIVVEEREGKKTVGVEVFQIGQGSFCTFGGIVYFRAGSVNTKLEGRTLQDYLVKRQILYFDEQASEAKLEDVDASKVRDFLKTRSPAAPFEEARVPGYLTSLGVAPRNGEFRLKNAGVLFFAREPARFVPQNEVKLARFAGTEPVEILDSRFVSRSITENLNEAEDFIKKNTRTAIKIGRLKREEAPEYPAAVIREALVNALTHRDYFSRDSTQINIFDDRIEFISPGTLPTGLSRQILGTLSIQRNPLTYRLMRDVGLVEGLGTGIPRMRSEMRKAGLPEPRFEELGNFFRVILYNKARAAIKGISDRQHRALAYLEKNPALTSKTYAKMVGVSRPIAVSDLNDLCAKGYLKKVGKTRGAHYVSAKNH